MPSLYINTYAPLVASPAGVTASVAHAIPPFVDGSIRREPDLEHAYPSISCICRADKFAPRLRRGDLVVYMTKKATHGGGSSHWRMTAVLRVHMLFANHEAAAAWYRSKELPVPSNCMVDGNPPNGVERSHRCNDHCRLADVEFTERWDEGYRQRARECGRFVACEKLWSELGWDAPRVHEDDLVAVFGRVPGTRNPGKLPVTHLEPLLARMGLSVPPSSP